MPRKRTFPPYPRKAHASGQARIAIAGTHHYLGPYQSPESYAEYERLLNEWRVHGAALAAGEAGAPAAGGIRTVKAVLARFWLYAEAKYTADELTNFRFSLRPLV